MITDGAEKHFMLLTFSFSRAFLIIVFELNTMYNEVWGYYQ